MNQSLRLLIALTVLVLIGAQFSMSADILSAGKKGKWSSDTTWVGGVVPGPGDNVTIANRDTVVFDMDSTEVANLTVGQGDSTSLRVDSAKVTKLTITGNLLVQPMAEFRVLNRVPSAPTNLVHTLVMYGNLTSNGAIDLRRGSAGSTLGVMNILWVGSSNSTVSTPGRYTKDTHEFNGMTLNKTGGANLLLGSNVYCAGGSSTQPVCDPIFTFVRGKVITGEWAFVHMGTTQTYIAGMSDSTYFVGALGRGLSNSAGNSKTFPVGDEFGYRPIKVGSTTPGVNTGHHVIVRVKHADANTGSSSLVGGMDKVSAVRYYEITYRAYIASSAQPADTMAFSIFGPNYGIDDGIRAGNTNLRVAYSIDSRATWTKIAMLDSHTTNLNILPRQINPDSIRPYFVLDTLSTVAYIALADSGGVNPLDGTYSGFSWNPSSISFGPVLLGTSKLDSMVVHNTGTGTMTVRSITRLDTTFHYTPSMPLTVPAGGNATIYIRFEPDSLGPITGGFVLYHDAPNNPDTLLLSGSGESPISVPVPLIARWNMVSNPLVTLNDSVGILFPSATSNAFRFVPGVGYSPAPLLTPGDGYWLKFPAEETVSVFGGSRPSAIIPVEAGWNLIGSISSTIPASSVTGIGTSVAGYIYKYNQGYTVADSIRPGEGYWVKVTTAGELDLSSLGPVAPSEVRNRIPEELNFITISDAAGNIQSLYFDSRGETSVELPPAPPAGIFDARFGSVDVTGAAITDGVPVRISSAVYPVTVNWKGSSGHASAIVVNGREVSLNSKGSVTLTSPSESLVLRTDASGAIPGAYRLHQNFPNPFNPSTSIAFDLPFSSIVTLKVYNVLGQEVARVLDGVAFAPGTRKASFDASHLPSGAYLCRLTAEQIADRNMTAGTAFTSVMRMLLVK